MNEFTCMNEFKCDGESGIAEFFFVGIRSVLEGVKQVGRVRQVVNEEEMTVVKVEGGNGEGGGDDNNE